MRKLWLMFVVILFFVCIIVNSIIMHEEAHKAIFRNYGCNDVIIEYHVFSSSFTKCLSNTTLSESQELAMENEHSFNEVVEYNVNTLIMCFFVLCSLLVFLHAREEL